MDWFNQDRYEMLLDQADAEFSGGRPEAAEQTVTLAIEQFPDHHEAWTLRACIRTDLRDLEHAREDANRAVMLKGGGEAFLCRARIEYELQEYEAAARDLDEALADGISDPDTHNLEGLILLATDQPLKAAEAFRMACKLNPDEPEFELNRGNALFRMNEPGLAIDIYTSVIRRYPHLAEARYRRGGLLIDTGFSGLAIADFREAVRLRNDDPEYHWALGTALEAESAFEEAEGAYSAALRMAPDDIVYRETRAHFRLTRRRDFAGALEDYDRLIKEFPDHLEYHAYRAAVYLTMGNREAADADLNAAGERAPDTLAGALQRMLSGDPPPR